MAEGRTAPGPVRVVLCDDVAMLRDLMREELQADDTVDVVGEAADGIEVVELARRVRPEIVVLNLLMPRRDGLEALPLLRALDRAPEILVFSGYSAEQMEPRALALGAAAYVQKGGSPGEIRDAVGALVRQLREPS